MALIKSFLSNEHGATAIEYGLIAGIIGLGIVASLGSITDAYLVLYQNIRDGIASR